MVLTLGRDFLLGIYFACVCVCCSVGLQAASVHVGLAVTGLFPQDLMLNAGDMIIWTAQDSKIDTISYGGDWESPLLNKGETFRFLFDEPGVYVYSAHYITESARRLYVQAGTVTVSANTNGSPVISLIAPVDGFFYTTSWAVILQASVEVPAATIQRVEFFANTNLVGVITNAPFRTFWTSPPEGKYAFTAVLSDSQGQRIVSRSSNIVVEKMDDLRGRIWGFRKLKEGLFVFHFNKGQSLQTCVHGSDDLSAWRDYVPPAAWSPGTFVDETASNSRSRFYRVGPHCVLGP